MQGIRVFVRQGFVMQDFVMSSKSLKWGVPDNVDVKPEIKWNTIRFQKCNQNYRMLVNICSLVLEGLLLSTEKRRPYFNH